MCLFDARPAVLLLRLHDNGLILRRALQVRQIIFYSDIIRRLFKILHRIRIVEISIVDDLVAVVDAVKIDKNHISRIDMMELTIERIFDGDHVAVAAVLKL